MPHRQAGRVACEAPTDVGWVLGVLPGLHDGRVYQVTLHSLFSAWQPSTDSPGASKALTSSAMTPTNSLRAGKPWAAPSASCALAHQPHSRLQLSRHSQSRMQLAALLQHQPRQPLWPGASAVSLIVGA